MTSTVAAQWTETPRKITGIDEDAGTITTSLDWDGSGNYADDDYLFRDGSYDTALTGVQGWIPDSAPGGGDSFFGIDRSTYGVRVYGSRFTAVSGTHNIERALRSAAARLDQLGARQMRAS